MKKLSFKKSGMIDTATAVLIGAAGNAVMDMAVEKVEALSSLPENVVDLIKVGVGVLGGSISANKYVHQATDGVAVVGASNIVKSVIDGTFKLSNDDKKEGGENGSSGLRPGTIGRVRAGNRSFMRRGRVAGLAGAMSM